MTINNDFYNDYGDKWYTATDDPVALLRAEGELKQKWISQRLKPQQSILDVGCGAGFLCHYLAKLGHKVTGLDLSESSIQVAARHDTTQKVKYLVGNAYQLPFPDAYFDVVTNMDFLEHIDQPIRSISECARVLKPGGQFYFHTFNRNILSHLIVIKAVEYFVKNTPKDMHVINLFLKPQEVEDMCRQSQLKVTDWTGVRPEISFQLLKLAWSGHVPADLKFKLTRSKAMSYMGMAVRV